MQASHSVANVAGMWTGSGRLTKHASGTAGISGWKSVWRGCERAPRREVWHAQSAPAQHFSKQCEAACIHFASIQFKVNRSEAHVSHVHYGFINSCNSKSPCCSISLRCFPLCPRTRSLQQSVAASCYTTSEQ
jgi:hypothetical protein